MNYINRLSEALKKEQFILDLRTIFGGADLADMQLISKFNKGFRFLLCVIDIFSKYAEICLKKKKIKQDNMEKTDTNICLKERNKD